MDRQSDLSTDGVPVLSIPDTVPVEHASAPLRIAIAGTFTLDPVQAPIEFWMETLEIAAEVVLAPYAQVMQQLLNPQSALATNQAGINVLLVRLQDWCHIDDADELDGIERRLDRNVHDFVTALTSFQKKNNVQTLLFLCPPSDALEEEQQRILVHAERMARVALGGTGRLQCFDNTDLAALYPVSRRADLHADRLGHIPYTDEYFGALATFIARRIATINKPQFKVVALDCDGTLWRGVCGEDGASGVEITQGHRKFQELLVRLHDDGVLLCLCSKNNSSDVEAVFRHHTTMPLRPEHLISSRVNWQPKSANLRDLARELQLGLDSFIFIDDSPLECAEVRTHCPSVLALPFPSSVADISRFLKHTWAFDARPTTQESKRRTAQYRENAARAGALQQAGDLRTFLDSLELVVNVTPMESSQLPRAAELIQRTNQFNLRTIRRKASEIESPWRAGEIESLVVHAKDRFGDYGLVGVVLFRRAGLGIDVDTFVLSCRALGRGVEHRVVNELKRLARSDLGGHVVLRFRRTERNRPAEEFLEKYFAQFCEPASSETRQPVERIYKVPATFGDIEPWGDAREQLTVTASGVESGDANQTDDAGGVHRWHERVQSLIELPDILAAIAESAPRIRRGTGGYVPARSPTELSIAEIWREVLQVDRVGIRDNFFDLGGNSLQGVRVISRIATVLRRELTLQEFCETPTVSGLAASLEHAREVDGSIDTADRSQPLPLSWSQQRLWFIDQLEGGSSAYHIPILLRLTGELSGRSLRTALDALLARHEALRTSFISVENEPRQSIAPTLSLDLGESDLSALDEGTQATNLHALVEQQVARPFLLNKGPLIRAHLFRLGGQEHQLLITVHHMVADGWSVSVLVEDLAALYRAAVGGEAAALPPLPVQYADYAVWQRQWSEAIAKDQLSYWVQHLEGAPELLELPADRPRPPVQSYRGKSVPLRLNAESTAAFKALSRRYEVTLATALYAAWAVLLSRLSGQQDITVGIPVANRRRAELESVVGFFVNTLAVRMRMEDDPDFATLLTRAKGVLLESYSHQDVPFEHVVQAIQPARSLSHSPIFQVMLVLQPTLAPSLHVSGLTMEPQDAPTSTAQFDLMLSLRESGDELFGQLNFATDLYEESTAKRWAGCLEVLLNSIVRQPECAISRLPILSADERSKVVKVFNDTAVPFDDDKHLHELFEAQVERTPHAVAVACGQQSLTYAELNARANQLARYLIDCGVGPDQLVGVCAERGLEMVTALYGILKSGAAYVPLDPSYPVQRLEYMLMDAAPSVLLTQEKLIPLLPPTSARIVSLDTAWARIAALDSSNIDLQSRGLRPHHLAYVIYTSGSTGNPKGAMNEHRAVVNRLQWMQRTYQLNDRDCVLQKTPFSFDVSVWEFFWPLLNGARLVLARPDGHKDPRYLCEVIDSTQVTTLHFVPSMLQVFLDQHIGGACPSLRQVICSGEELPASLVRAFFRSFPNVQLHNLYGPTEAAIDVTAWECTPAHASDRVPIGRPISNVQMYVLDRHREPVPIGVSGEIYIAGVGVGRGYLNRPELTAERFLPDPFRTEAGARLYKTGDVGRWRLDGAIEYLGRNDHQVKIRGFRIELGEIETRLTEHPQIREATVLAREDVAGEKRLVAYLTLLGDVFPGHDVLRAHLRATLPDYMIPSAFVVLDEMPLSPNGKLERRALPAPDRVAFGETGYEAPVGEVETFVAETWCRLLGLERAGRDDNFFHLGGHSLLAMQAIAPVQAALSVELPIRVIFDAPTVREFADAVESLRRTYLLKQLADGGSELEAMLESVASMPESQVEQLLQELVEERAL